MCNIIELLSEKRLAKYGSVDDPQTKEKYFFNIELCESFYPLLSQFEVVLRNKIDLVFSKHFGSNWIFDFVAKDAKLTTEKEITDRNELIDSLTFAFWSRLFMQEYTDTIWDQHPEILIEIFSKRREHINLKKVSYEINQIRLYRNRFSHNGSLLICPPRKMACHTVHNLLLRMMRELEADSILDHIKRFDKFDSVFKRGVDSGFITCKI